MCCSTLNCTPKWYRSVSQPSSCIIAWELAGQELEMRKAGADVSRITPSATLALLSLIAAPGLLAQYMDDTSYTYGDMWADDSGIYAYGQTDGVLTSIHDYAVDVQLSSPGRQNIITGNLTNGTAASLAFLSWDTNDVGNYTASTTHRGWCYVGMTMFYLASGFYMGVVGESETYYTTPVHVQPVPLDGGAGVRRMQQVGVPKAVPDKRG
jgi:hypothetical protein